MHKMPDSGDEKKITPKPTSWFGLRMFYVRVSNCEVDESTPDRLTVTHIPLTPNTVLEVSGKPSSINSDHVSSSLRRDRVDKRSEEATFVSTERVRMTGSARFEVCNKDELLLVGVLELRDANGFNGEAKKNHGKKWGMRCQAVKQRSSGFLKGRLGVGSEMALPAIEVYIAGCFEGSPVILTKAMQLGFRRKHQVKALMDPIPECKPAEQMKQVPQENASQPSEYRCYKPEMDVDVDYNSIYASIEGEDGELSWFNAGVRVGVGIGLGICLGIGIGAGLLVRSYQATTRNFKRRLI